MKPPIHPAENLGGKKLAELPARLYFCVVLGVLALFFLPARSGTFIFRDAFNLFYPYKAVEAEFLRRVSVCLWNPYEVLGSPFVAELAPGWFYPGNFLFWILPVEPACRSFIVLHFFLAAVFMWLWLRELGLAGAAAATGTLSYTLSGYVLSQHGLPDMLAACAWLPASLWFFERWLKRRRAFWLAALGFSLAMPFLAGRAEAAPLAVLGIAFWSLFSPAAGPGLRSRLRALFYALSIAGAFALLLSMIQFLPSLELGRLSQKAAGFDPDTAMLWSLHPRRLMEFILPSPWGRFWPENTFTGHGLTGWEGYYPWSLSEYAGLVILGGGLYGFLRAGWRGRLLAGGAFLAVMLLSFGRHSFLYPALYRALPFFRSFRYPEKFMILVVLLLAGGGAGGLNRLLFRLEEGLSRRVFSLLGAALVATAAAWVVFNLLPSAFPAAAGDWFRRQVNHAALMALAFGGGYLVCAFFRAQRAVGILFVTLASLDLYLANHWLIPYAEPGIYKEEPAALKLIRDYDRAHGSFLFDGEGRGRLGRERILREAGADPGRLSAVIPGASDLERYRRWEIHTLAPNFNFLHRLEAMTGYTAAATARFDQIMRAGLTLQTMALFNVRYVISPDRGSVLEKQGLIVAGARHDYGFKVFVIPDTFPRAYLVGKSVRTKKDADDFQLLQKLDFRKQLVLEETPDLPPPEQESDLTLTAAEIVSYLPHEVRLRTRAEKTAYLVLSDSYFPGWLATVDDRPATVFRANFLVRAVRVPPGEHEVAFRYQPRSYIAGKAVSAAVILALALLAAGSKVRWLRD